MQNFAKKYPNLALEWHNELNEGVDPNKLSHGSGKKVWWKCSKSELHVWQTEFRGRISGNGCPFCSGKKVSADNNLENQYPNIAKEWHPIKNKYSPSEIFSSSHKKVWWKCPKGKDHEWQTPVYQRTIQNTGCPFCSGRRATVIENLETKFPELILEWHPSKNESLCPSKIKPKSGQMVWWKCKIYPSHEWRCRVIERTSRGSGCPYCSGHRVSAENNLKKNKPHLIKEWNFEKNGKLRPEHFTVSSGRKVWWRCKRFPEHEWKASIANRIRGKGCPYCTTQTSEPEIRIVCELRKLFGQRNVDWRIKICGYEVDVFLKHSEVCIEFDGLKWHEKRNIKDKQKNKELNNLGFTIIRLRQKPLPLIGSLDISVNSEFTKKDMNSLISNLKIILHEKWLNDCENYIKKNDFINQKDYNKFINYLPNPPPEHSLMSKYPDVCSEWDYEKNYPLTPKNFLPFSHRKVWWKCVLGHEYQAVIAIKTAGKKCQKCNTLQVLFSEIASEWHPYKNGDLTPDQVTKNSRKRVWWRCKSNNGHEWQATIDNRSRGTRCPYCAGSYATPSHNLKVVAPDLCNEWHPNKNLSSVPENYLPNSNKIVWWSCKQNPQHEWQDMINRRRNGKGCPFCKK